MILHLHALTDPLRPALVVRRVARSTTASSRSAINRLTHGLRALGVGPGERVAAFLHNGHEYLELTRGARVARRRQRADRLSAQGAEVAYILENSGARALVFHGDLAPRRRGGADAGQGRQHVARERCIAARRRARGLSRATTSCCARRRSPTEPPRVRGRRLRRRHHLHVGHHRHAKGATRDFRRTGIESVLDFIVAASRCAPTIATSSCARSITRRRRRSSRSCCHRRRRIVVMRPLRSRAGAAHHRARAHHVAR